MPAKNQQKQPFDEFVKEFYRYLSDYDTHEKAYEANERRHKRLFGCRRFKNFQSFRQMKNRKLA